jgi:hypothetical protein
MDINNLSLAATLHKKRETLLKAKEILERNIDHAVLIVRDSIHNESVEIKDDMGVIGGFGVMIEKLIKEYEDIVETL